MKYNPTPRNHGRRLAASASVLGIVAAGLLAAGPASTASAATTTTADSIGWYRPSDSSWHLSFDTPPGGESDVAFVNGPVNSGGVVALAGDWDGNGSDSIAWYRSSDASWHMSNDLSGGPSDSAFVWGPAGDTSTTPIVGDWNGDGKDTVGWYRPSDGSYHLASANTTSASSSAFVWGPAGNTSVQPVVGDWNGDGKDTVGWYRPSDGSYHLAGANHTNATSSAFAWGPTRNSAVIPVVGDWDGRTVTDPPPSTGLPSNPSRAETVAHARSFLGQGLSQIRSSTSAPWSSYPNADWCAWFVTWVERKNTGGIYETYADKMGKLGSFTNSPQAGDVVIIGDFHTGILSKKVNGAWYMIDGNGGMSGPTIMTRKVIERAVWYGDGVRFVHVDH